METEKGSRLKSEGVQPESLRRNRNLFLESDRGRSMKLVRLVRLVYLVSLVRLA